MVPCSLSWSVQWSAARRLWRRGLPIERSEMHRRPSSCQKWWKRCKWSTLRPRRTGMAPSWAQDSEIHQQVPTASTRWTIAQATSLSAAKTLLLSSWGSSIARLWRRGASALSATWWSTVCVKSTKSKNIRSATLQSSRRSSRSVKPCALSNSFRSLGKTVELIIVQTDEQMRYYIFSLFTH